MRILVIGGTGFIGPYVVRYLADRGHEVAVFHRGKTEAELPPEVRHIHHESGGLGDRGYFARYKEEFKGFAPDVVLDMIPMTEPDARALAGAFKDIARRVVAISSQDVYLAYDVLRGVEPGLEEPLPLSEEALLRRKLYPYQAEPPRSPDDPQKWMDRYEKILVEMVVLSEPDLPGTVLRLPMVYGPRDKQHRNFEYLKRMDDGRPVILLAEGLARWRWTRGYVENVAAAVSLAVAEDRAAGRIYNVGEADPLTEAEWVAAIGRAAGWGGKVAAVPAEYLPAHLAVNLNVRQHLVTDTTRIRKELGFQEQVSLEVGLRRTVEWERAHPPLGIDPERFDYAAEEAALAKFTSRRGGN